MLLRVALAADRATHDEREAAYRTYVCIFVHRAGSEANWAFWNQAAKPHLERAEAPTAWFPLRPNLLWQATKASRGGAVTTPRGGTTTGSVPGAVAEEMIL